MRELKSRILLVTRFLIIPVIIFFNTLNVKSYSQEIQIGTSVGVILHLGDFSSYYSSGYSLQSNIVFSISDNTQIEVLVRYEKLFIENTSRIKDYNRSHLIFGLGPKYLLSQDKFTPYLGLEALIGIDYEYLEFKNATSKIDVNDGPIYGLVPKLGFLYSVSDRIRLDADIKIIYWLGDTSIYCVTPDIGVVFSF